VQRLVPAKAFLETIPRGDNLSTTPSTSSNPGYGILAVGAYLPRLRLDRATVAGNHRWMAPGLKGLARGTRSMANWDEDALTMAVEASRAALKVADAQDLQGMVLASRSLPFSDRLNAGIVRSALALPAAMHASDAAGSLRAGTTELLRVLHAPHEKSTLVVASENRKVKPASSGELLSGDGAAAVVVGYGNPVAVLRGSASEAHDFIDHFREAGRDSDYQWEERWVREEGFAKIIPPVVKAALQSAGYAADDIDHFVMPAALPRVNEVMAKKLGIRPEAVTDTLFEACGDTGCAHPLMMLAHTLAHAKPGQKILVVQFGSGCDAMVLETTQWLAPNATSLSCLQGGLTEFNYLKFLSFTGQIELEWGMRAEMDNKTALSAAWRNEPLIHGFMGGRCNCCGTVQFPSSRICVNPACGKTDTQEPYRLSDEGAQIRSYTCDWLSYRQCPPFQFGHVEFASGARVLMEFTDSEPEELAVGTPLTMAFRIKEVDPLRGFRRYFWKAIAQKQIGEV
jgi:hydroxymethylglutaryl-CoA synthase